MYIENVRVFDEKGFFIKKDICVSDGRFSDESNDEVVIDGKDCYMIPGLIDIHFHGCMGADVCDGDEKSIDTICKYELSNGITSICPATMTIPIDELKKSLATISKYSVNNSDFLRSNIVGINLEGPFISREKCGAHKAEYIRECDIKLFKELNEAANGLIKIVDVAPEKDGAIDFIKEISSKVAVSIAHTIADFDKSIEAFKAGASHMTHMYNAMPSFNHRKPGPIGAALDTKNVYVELICDGVHVHPSVIRASYEMFGPDRIIVISDSMRATGLTDGKYSLGGQEVIVNEGRACLDDGTIAGSVCNLMDGLKFLVKEAKISLEDAVTCATVNPAIRLGIFDKVGSIENGKIADFVLLDDKLRIVDVYKEGQKVCQ